eukprot:1159098-Pelagomonas_calceolata.AAC.15
MRPIPAHAYPVSPFGRAGDVNGASSPPVSASGDQRVLMVYQTLVRTSSGGGLKVVSVAECAVQLPQLLPPQSDSVRAAAPHQRRAAPVLSFADVHQPPWSLV